MEETLQNYEIKLEIENINEEKWKQIFRTESSTTRLRFVQNDTVEVKYEWFSTSFENRIKSDFAISI